MTDHELMQTYRLLLPFLAKVMGRGCEIILHDVSDLDHSLAAIENNLSGREIGNPITTFARDLVESGVWREKEYVVNYSGRSKGGDFLSSTYFIKNGDRLIGLMCFNKDLSAVQGLEGALRALRDRYNLIEPETSEIRENLDNPMSNLVRERIDEVIGCSGVSPDRLSIAEKVSLVQRLSDSGVLMMKGAVAYVAQELHVSVPTIYRYLKRCSQ